jgi:hypothetical protein
MHLIVAGELLFDEIEKSKVNIVARRKAVPQVLTRFTQRLPVEGVVDTRRLFRRVNTFGQPNSLPKRALMVPAIQDQPTHDLKVMVREAGVLPVPKTAVLFSVVAAGDDLLVSSFEVVAAVNDMAVVNPVTSPFLRVKLGHVTLL